jgi:hypothetical protein
MSVSSADFGVFRIDKSTEVPVGEYPALIGEFTIHQPSSTSDSKLLKKSSGTSIIEPLTALVIAHADSRRSGTGEGISTH